MSHRDPALFHFNPSANDFAPTQEALDISNQVSTPLSPYLEARFFNMEEEYANLRGDVDTLKELYHGLSSSIDKLKKGGWPVHVGPFQEVDLTQSHQNAIRFKEELEKLGREFHEAVDGIADNQKMKTTATSETNSSVPAHMGPASADSKAMVSKSLPPHVRASMKTGISNGNG